MAESGAKEPMITIQNGFQPKTGGIGTRWPVLVACFVSQLTTGSMAYHTGVLYVAMLETFRPIASLVVTMFGCRTSLILAGLVGTLGMSTCFFIKEFVLLYPALFVAGLGQGLSMTGSFVALGYHFPDKASLVTGICVSGAGLGTFIHPPLLQILVDEHGLHGAMLVIGAVCLHSIPCGLAVPASPFEQSRRQQPNAPALAKLPGTLASLLRAHVTVLSDFRFLLFLLSFLAFSLGTSTLYLYLPDFLQHRGYDSLTASLVISATGIGSVVSRLLTGIATHDDRIDMRTIYIGIHGLAVVVTLLLPVTVGSTVAHMSLAVVFGFYSGSSWALHSPMVLQLLGVHVVATGMGVYFLTMGVAYVTGPPLAGRIYLAQESFQHIFYFSAGMYGFACLGGMLLVAASGTDVQEGDKSVKLIPEQDSLCKSCEVDVFSDVKQSQPRTRDPLLQQSEVCDDAKTLLHESKDSDTPFNQSNVSDALLATGLTQSEGIVNQSKESDALATQSNASDVPASSDDHSRAAENQSNECDALSNQSNVSDVLAILSDHNRALVEQSNLCDVGC